MVFARNVSDHVVRMAEGTIVTNGPPGEMLDGAALAAR
jgi:ABC-type histidine transport system ATPase subunit